MLLLLNFFDINSKIHLCFEGVELFMKWWAWLIISIVALIVGFIAGFFTARAVLKRYMKKNPPINEKMIRVMYQQMGRTPTEAQVRRVMKSMEEAK